MRVSCAGAHGESPCSKVNPTRALDFVRLHWEEQSHRYLALELQWEECRQEHSDGFGYSHSREACHRRHRHPDVSA